MLLNVSSKSAEIAHWRSPDAGSDMAIPAFVCQLELAIPIKMLLEQLAASQQQELQHQLQEHQPQQQPQLQQQPQQQMLMQPVQLSSQLPAENDQPMNDWALADAAWAQHSEPLPSQYLPGKGQQPPQPPSQATPLAPQPLGASSAPAGQREREQTREQQRSQRDVQPVQSPRAQLQPAQLQTQPLQQPPPSPPPPNRAQPQLSTVAASGRGASPPAGQGRLAHKARESSPEGSQGSSAPQLPPPLQPTTPDMTKKVELPDGRTVTWSSAIECLQPHHKDYVKSTSWQATNGSGNIKRYRLKNDGILRNYVPIPFAAPQLKERLPDPTSDSPDWAADSGAGGSPDGPSGGGSCSLSSNAEGHQEFTTSRCHANDPQPPPQYHGGMRPAIPDDAVSPPPGLPWPPGKSLPQQATVAAVTGTAPAAVAAAAGAAAATAVSAVAGDGAGEQPDAPGDLPSVQAGYPPAAPVTKQGSPAITGGARRAAAPSASQKECPHQ